MQLTIRTVGLMAFMPMLLAFSCNTANQQTDQKGTPGEKSIRLIKIASPSNGTLYPVGSDVEISIKLLDESVVPDSIALYVNDRKMGQITGLTSKLLTLGFKLGTQTIRATAWKGGLRQSASATIKLKSNVAPKEFTYKVIKTFPHDPEAYTQGLFYHEGNLYEGTGQQGRSSIRKVELETGKILQSVNLEKNHFGEGIAKLGDRIYQLTWTSGVGFTYDFASFKQTGTFSYQTQGWGLTTNGRELIMSDGSNTIYFVDPESFTELRRIEVFDDRKAVDQLNELELINGELFANVYQTDRW
jgi:glutamine cyclotransferase